MGIGFFLLHNRQGKVRLAKYYGAYNDSEKRRIEYEVHRIVTSRSPKHTNFVEFRQQKIVYRRYAGLFFSMGIDISDNELAYLEAIHLFVEVLDHYFSNVCELDIIFNFHKVRHLLFFPINSPLANSVLASTQTYLLLDEFILGGELQETSKNAIMNRLHELEKMPD
jgi:hypothetical protein